MRVELHDVLVNHTQYNGKHSLKPLDIEGKVLGSLEVGDIIAAILDMKEESVPSSDSGGPATTSPTAARPIPEVTLLDDEEE